ncbi:MAG: hypothetical protein JSW41_01725 [Candidatus Aenigmatarchaeota archaeon]|nr:MAG: hypothetical protein JSW41_01725 [Candidatus Aenigmarchaeota archaeon]
MTQFERIGKAIKKRRKALKIKVKDIDSVLADAFKIKPLTARNYREFVEQGYIYGTPAYIGKKEYGQVYMNRLSFYMGELDFDEADITIVRIKLIDNRFNYPLPDLETNFQLP